MPVCKLSYPAKEVQDSGALMCTSYGASLHLGSLFAGSEAIGGCAGLDFRNIGFVGDDALGGKDGFGLWGC